MFFLPIDRACSLLLCVYENVLYQSRAVSSIKTWRTPERECIRHLPGGSKNSAWRLCKHNAGSQQHKDPVRTSGLLSPLDGWRYARAVPVCDSSVHLPLHHYFSISALYAYILSLTHIHETLPMSVCLTAKSDGEKLK